MIDWLYQTLMWTAAVTGGVNLLLALFQLKPNSASRAIALFIEIGLFIQLVATIILLIQGQTSAGSIFEFFGYLLVAMLIPAGAVVWSLVDSSRQASVILGLAPMVIAVMLYRMMSIWSGQ